MTIKQGDQLPQGSFRTMTADGPKELSTDDIFKGKNNPPGTGMPERWFVVYSK